jgi:hypothetical protein
MSSVLGNFVTSTLRGKYFYLLACLLLLFLVYPFVRGDVFGVSFLDIFSTAILFAAIYAVRHSRRYLLAAVVFAIPAVATNWAYQFAKTDWLNLISDGLYALYFLFAASIILFDVLQGEKVTFDKIYGAVCAYFLIGMVWASVFSVIETASPGSFRMSVAPGAPGRTGPSAAVNESDLNYHSFVTLTTLGYGDITPFSPPARSLSTLEAMIGQLYLTVLVARLVGLHIAHSHPKEPMA